MVDKESTGGIVPIHYYNGLVNIWVSWCADLQYNKKQDVSILAKYNTKYDVKMIPSY